MSSTDSIYEIVLFFHSQSHLLCSLKEFNRQEQHRKLKLLKKNNRNMDFTTPRPRSPPLCGLTGPASWWWLSPASPGSAAAERRRHRGLPSPALGPGRYLCPEAARPAGTAETNNPVFTYLILILLSTRISFSTNTVESSLNDRNIPLADLLH